LGNLTVRQLADLSFCQKKPAQPLAKTLFQSLAQKHLIIKSIEE
jgi:hypothetical protein